MEEWEQFQNDLLMTVRVANNFKTEAQHDLEKLEEENVLLKERVKQMEMEKAKGGWLGVALVWEGHQEQSSVPSL